MGFEEKTKKMVDFEGFERKIVRVLRNGRGIKVVKRVEFRLRENERISKIKTM